MLPLQYPYDRNCHSLAGEPLSDLELKGRHALVVVEDALHKLRSEAVISAGARAHHVPTQNHQGGVAAQSLHNLAGGGPVPFRYELEVVFARLQEVVIGAADKYGVPSLVFSPKLTRLDPRPRVSSNGFEPIHAQAGLREPTVDVVYRSAGVLQSLSICHPPVTTSGSVNWVLKVSVRTDITMRVKKTSANIARVRPVRSLALMG